jgi:hypothetical protein
MATAVAAREKYRKFNFIVAGATDLSMAYWTRNSVFMLLNVFPGGVNVYWHQSERRWSTIFGNCFASERVAAIRKIA